MIAIILAAILSCPTIALAAPEFSVAKKLDAPSELLNLLEVDFAKRPELRPLAAGLSATFQILTRRRPKPGTTDPRARPPEEEGGEALISICTGSFIGPSSVATAHHCISRDNASPEQLAERLVLRRHLFRIESGRLVRRGYENYSLTGKILLERADLSVLELSAATPAPKGQAFKVPDSSFDYAPGEVFHALGYPSDRYAVPYLAYDCRITPTTHSDILPGREYQGNCHIQGGMSGGPQFLSKGKVQIGVNSMNQDLGGVFLSGSPRLRP